MVKKDLRIPFFNLVILVLITGLLSACVPSAGTNSRSTNTTSDDIDGGVTTGTGDNPTGTGTGSDTTFNPPTTFTQPVVWYANQAFEAIINLNSNYTDSLYLRGADVHSFITNNRNDVSVISKKYCLVITYADEVSTYPLRIHATPFLFGDVNGTDYGLKLHLTNAALNQEFCSGNVEMYDINDEVVRQTGLGAYDMPTLCTTCGSAKTSQDLHIYESTTNGTSYSIDQDWLLSPNSDGSFPVDLGLGNLQLRIDYSATTETSTAQCTNSSCLAEGFDCCVDGIQCADDGAERPATTAAFACLKHVEENAGDYSNCSPEFNVSSYNNTLIQYGQAYYDSKIFTTQNFIRYPNFYFTCSSTVPGPVVTPDPTPENAEEDAGERLAELIKEFNCLEEGKEENPDFASKEVCEPTFDEVAYEAIRLKVWKDCGCQADPFPTNTEDLRCPDFGLTAVEDTAGNITRVDCFNPPVEVETPPFQELDLAIPNRSAPHRFFSTDGTEYETIENISSTVPVVQEGDDFSYLDESSKQGPQFGGAGADISEQGFGMNSILGRMSVELNRALPAKVVNVEFDQTYVISASNGFYTPCPLCVSDSWFPTFKSLPSSTKGLGVQAVGYTTTRDAYKDNYSLGNYEDTKFGRACWVPPTMLPFSHQPATNSQTQRLNRLETQAALYANGYQRDWYGFNQGALIGSFDGVSWFAIGKGRRVQAKSKKLYLAINAPFADLADPGTTTVSIVVDLGSNTAADYDFDPEVELNHPTQNDAGSCQSYHQCNTDTDCISQLGWEYSCLDINELKSHWPKFDVDGKESANTQLGNLSFDQILNGGINGQNTKRCVYRGMGAICKRDYSTLNSARPDLQKAFRCAPNFYCAELASNQFNDNVVRSPNQLSVYFFGHEADFLGRPQNYMGANRALSSEIQANLTHNFRIFSADVTDFGLCRPGRSLDTANDLTNHADPDSRQRSDYISQIGSCNSQLDGQQRTRTCPLIDMDPDSDNFLNVIDGASADQAEKQQQNMCGNESRYFNGSENKSTFEEIELEKIASLFSLSVPGLPVDACLRRAGQVCFTDLDCGPNRLHSEQAVFLSTDRFGGSEAERSYWSESLICSQASEIPTLQADDFYDYDLTQNRCCREIASDFTMYSKVSDNQLSPDIGIDANLNLDIGEHTSTDPLKDKRYSRYNNLTLIPASSIDDSTEEANYIVDADDDGTFDTNNYVIPAVAENTKPAPFQWRTFQETGQLTCCGGGWVRKFADGTQDWSNNLRQSYNTSNFQCLNYHDTMYKVKPDDTPQGSYTKEKSKLCFTPDKAGCVQTPMNEDEGEGFDIIPPTNRNVTFATIDTTPTEQNDQTSVTLSREAPYIPLPANNNMPFSTDENSAYFPFWIGHHDSTSVNGQRHWAISLHLPIYVGGPANITSIEVHYEHSSLSAQTSKVREATQVQGSCFSLGNNSIEDGFDQFTTATSANADYEENGDDEYFCIQYTGDQYILHVSAQSNPGVFLTKAEALDDENTEIPWEWAGVKINFNALGASEQLSDGRDVPTSNEHMIIAGNRAGLGLSQGAQISADTLGLEPGNALYYLSKLGRFELTGIPQIFYEPLYCNDDRSQLVPGLFNADISTRTDFEAESWSYSGTTGDLERLYDEDHSSTDQSKSANNPVVFQDKVQLNQIFSGHEFRCCAKLGSVVSSASRCCSGHAVDADDSTDSSLGGKSICKLPRNTNINVYFNRFVSSEGSIADDAENGLREDDFVPETGEPKIQSTTYTKLAALASLHCDSGEFRRGASFGEYPAQPNTGFFGDVEDTDATFYYSMVDSGQDFNGESEKGFDYFIFGLRWDHHLYCQ